jgi:hypothetical protein
MEINLEWDPLVTGNLLEETLCRLARMAQPELDLLSMASRGKEPAAIAPRLAEVLHDHGLCSDDETVGRWASAVSQGCWLVVPHPASGPDFLRTKPLN